MLDSRYIEVKTKFS